MVGAVGTAHSCSNPNTIVWNSKGIWLTYVLLILLLHLILLCVPGTLFESISKVSSSTDAVMKFKLSVNFPN